MNTKTLLNISFFLTIVMCGYKETTAMNAPMPFARCIATGIAGYSPLWIQQCIHHGIAKDKQDITAMNTANKLLAASLITPLIASSLTQVTQAGIKKAFNKNPTKRSQIVILAIWLVAGLDMMQRYDEHLTKNN